MANETATPGTGATGKPAAPAQAGTPAAGNLSDTIGQMAQMQVELVNNIMKSSLSVFEPVSKASIEITANALNALNQVMQNISAAIAPKK